MRAFSSLPKHVLPIVAKGCAIAANQVLPVSIVVFGVVTGLCVASLPDAQQSDADSSAARVFPNQARLIAVRNSTRHSLDYCLGDGWGGEAITQECRDARIRQQIVQQSIDALSP
jgi:hypothetical protein